MCMCTHLSKGLRDARAGILCQSWKSPALLVKSLLVVTCTLCSDMQLQCLVTFILLLQHSRRMSCERG